MRRYLPGRGGRTHYSMDDTGHGPFPGGDVWQSLPAQEMVNTALDGQKASTGNQESNWCAVDISYSEALDEGGNPKRQPDGARLIRV